MSEFLIFFVMFREYVPSNIMFDKRVYRGSTNAAMVIPAGTYPDNLFQNQKQNNAQMK